MLIERQEWTPIHVNNHMYSELACLENPLRHFGSRRSRDVYTPLIATQLDQLQLVCATYQTAENARVTQATNETRQHEVTATELHNQGMNHDYAHKL